MAIFLLFLGSGVAHQPAGPVIGAHAKYSLPQYQTFKTKRTFNH